MSLSLAPSTLSPEAASLALALRRVVGLTITDRALLPCHLEVQKFVGVVAGSIVRQCPGLGAKLGVPERSVSKIVEEVVGAKVVHDVAIARLDIMDGCVYPGTNLRI